MAKSLRSSRALKSRTLRRKHIHAPVELARIARLAAKSETEKLQKAETDAERKVRILEMRKKEKKTGEEMEGIDESEEVKGEDEGEEEMQVENDDEMVEEERPKGSRHERVRTDVYPIHTGAVKVEAPKKEKPKKTKAQIKKRGRKRKFVWT